MKITILFFSTNRLEFLIPSLDTFFKYVDFGNHDIYSILIDDYPKDRDNEIFMKIQKKYKIDKLILHEKNEGYSKTWKEGWDNIPEDTEYIFHQEDDYTYHKKIDISTFIKIFEKCNKELYQIVLKRQIWYEPPESDLIYKIENKKIPTIEKKIEIDGNTHFITINRHIFNSNPCLYPYFVTRVKYKDTVQEHMILEYLLKKYPNIYSCFYGKLLDQPLITHIGHFTQGQKVLPGEPGYEIFKEYDPNKKYDAKKWLTEYNPDNKINQKYFSEIDIIITIKDTNKKIKKLETFTKNFPEFLDGYYYLMIEYQNKQQYLKAYTIGISAGNKWKKYKLFRSKHQQNIYNYLFQLNLAVNAYYSKFYDNAFIINSELLEKYPNDKKLIVNQTFYRKKTKLDTKKLTNDLVKHFNMNYPKIMIIDDFYKNPDKIRNFALNQEYNVFGNYPGKRTKDFKENYHKEMFEKLLGKEITYWPEKYNGCFQIVTKKDGNSWIHRDNTEYSALIFLNPNPEISSGGTIMYRHKKTGLLKANNKDDEKILSNSSNIFSDWEEIDKIGNLYNRCFLIQGKYNHKSNKYFGENLYDGRLFQIFFFNTKN